MYGLEKGLRNFLIDDKGVIVGVDLSPREVIRIVTGNRVAKAKPITNDRKELSHRIRRDNSFLFLGTSHANVARARSAEPSDKLLHQPFAKRRVRNGYQTAGTLA